MPPEEGVSLLGIFSANSPENRNANITTNLASIINAVSDFRLVVQIREEIEKVKNSATFTNTTQNIFPPIGTCFSGITKIAFPSSSGKPRVNVSDTAGPI